MQSHFDEVRLVEFVISEQIIICCTIRIVSNYLVLILLEGVCMKQRK